VAAAFGCVLRGFRRQKGLSQEELAFRADFDRTYSSLLERALRTPTLTVIFDLALALEVHPAFLVAMVFEEYARRVRAAAANGPPITDRVPPSKTVAAVEKGR
jgi:transcriptional regulator with XRE-family HTH domain